MNFCKVAAVYCFSLAFVIASQLPAHFGYVFAGLAALANIVFVIQVPHISQWAIPELMFIVLAIFAQFFFFCMLNDLEWSGAACCVLIVVEIALFLLSATRMELRDF